MGIKLDEHEDIGKRIAHYDDSGNITEDDEGKRIYTIQEAHILGDGEHIRYITFLAKREGLEDIYEQIEWKALDGNQTSQQFRTTKQIIDMNNQQFKWL